MTVAEGPRPDSRLLMWLGHYGIWVIIPLVALTLVNDAFRQAIGALDWIAGGAWVLFIAAAVIDHGYHEERLCERCVAATPLDPQAAVQRWMTALRLHHSRWRLWGMAVLLGVILAVTLVFGKATWTYWLDALFALYVVLFTAADWEHRRLYPWCPFCHWDDGGAKEPSPDVPAPAVSR